MAPIAQTRFFRYTASVQENPEYLTTQLITYLGNKRSLLQFIGNGLDTICTRLGEKKLSTFDVFSGSGVVSRYLKKYSSLLITNDLEQYASIINRCYLSNKDDLNEVLLRDIHSSLVSQLDTNTLSRGLLSQLYAPADDTHIISGERVFYTTRNAQYLDTARVLIEKIPILYQPYFLAPLLSEASVHANTSGVFKGFYKNSDTGVGQFGGKKEDAQLRIRGNISLPYPVFSNFSCETQILTGNAIDVCEKVPEVDVAYLDPPYNQHPYGSNYFMLNLLLNYQAPKEASLVSGIPVDWNRSVYNSKQQAYTAFSALVERIRAKFLIISFNSEGFISLDEMTSLLQKFGKLTILETKYNTFRGSRNLNGRGIHVTEYLYLLEKT